MSGGGYAKCKNDRGVPEICIGVKEFMCIGESPRGTTRTSTSIWARRTLSSVPCATRFRFSPGLTPLDAHPPDSFFADNNAV